MLKAGFALLFRNRDFGLLMAAQFAAQAGDGIVQTALAKSVAFGGQEGFDVEAARSPDELLRIVLYVFVAYTFFSPFVGVAIDRWRRERLLFVANGFRALAVAAVCIIGVSEVGDLPLFAVFWLTLASTRVVLATKSAALPATLGGSSLVQANAVSQLGGALFQLGGAGVAFIASTFLEAEPIALAGALVYAAGAIVALRIRRAEEIEPRSTLAAEIARVMRNIADGFRKVFGTPQAAVSVTTYFWLRLLWSFSIVSIGFAGRELIKDDDLQLLVLTGGAGAVGAALGFLSAGKLHDRVKTTARLVLGASLVAGGAVTVLGALEAKGTIALLTFFLGFGFFLAKISLDTLVQEALGDDFRGRAFSLYDIAYNLAWVLAAVILVIAYTDSGRGLLLASSGAAFLAGTAGLAGWFRRAGLLSGRVESAAR